MRGHSDRRTLVWTALAVLAAALAVLLPAFARPGAPAPAPAIECPDCNDFNACTVDSCDTTIGTCRHEALSCDDGNPCTTDTCLNDIATNRLGCFHTPQPDGTSCDDGNSCTLSDACGGGACAGTTQPAGTACDDGNSCTERDACSESGVCVGDPASVGHHCDDANACTSDDQCVAGEDGTLACSGTATTCDDGDPCTTDTCDPATGLCGTVPVNCDDGNACTDDACNPADGTCTRTFRTEPCDDGNFCTVDDACDAGNCVGGGTRDCNDTVACTTDVCVAADQRCAHVPDDTACGPGTACTGYTCDAVAGCVAHDLGGPCDVDGQDCLLQQCVRGSCTVVGFVPPGIACDDHVSCTGGDVCGQNGSCSGTTTGCDDNNPCTDDTCDTVTGVCAHSNNSRPCQDDGNVCTNDICDATTGTCAHVNNTAPCQDGNVCTAGDACENGVCRSGTTPTNCDDGMSCTLDVCNPTTGCSHPYDAREPDNDTDGIPDSCDNCPAAANRLQLDCNANGVGDACDASLYALSWTTSSRGSAIILWSTVCETDLRGFNVVTIDSQGRRTKLNPVLIPCEQCITGEGASYSTFLPKRKGAHNIYLEVVHRTSVNLTVGPAVRQ